MIDQRECQSSNSGQSLLCDSRNQEPRGETKKDQKGGFAYNKDTVRSNEGQTFFPNRAMMTELMDSGADLRHE